MDIMDPQGLFGATLVASMKVMLLGTSLLAFYYCWRRGLLVFDEGPKYQMMEGENSDER